MQPRLTKSLLGLTLGSVFPNGRLSWSVAGGLLAFAAIQAFCLLGASYMDGSWHLPPPGKGLLDHYGVWAILVADPLLLLASAYAYLQFDCAMASLPLSKDGKARTQEAIKPYRDTLDLNAAGAAIYLLSVATGLLCWLNNIRQTADPLRYFEHDVFDSTYHSFGFFANKAVLFASWVLIYPTCAFVIFVLSYATFMVLRVAKTERLLRPSVMHPDGSYGLGDLGYLNISLLVPFLMAYGVAFAILVTHDHPYASIVLPLIALTSGFIFISTITIYPIFSLAKEIEQHTYSNLERRSKIDPGGDSRTVLAFATERLCFALSKGSPYTRRAEALLFAMRLIPIAMTTFKVIWPVI